MTARITEWLRSPTVLEAFDLCVGLSWVSLHVTRFSKENKIKSKFINTQSVLWLKLSLYSKISKQIILYCMSITLKFIFVQMAYQYLHRAMAMRYDTRYGLLLKKPADPIPAYDNWKESTTLEVRIQGFLKKHGDNFCTKYQYIF